VGQASGTPSVQQPLTAGFQPAGAFEVVVRQKACAERASTASATEATNATTQARAKRTPGKVAPGYNGEPMSPTKRRRSLVSVVPLVLAGGAATVLLAGPACSGSKGAASQDGGEPHDVAVVESAAEASFDGVGTEPEAGPAGFVFFSTSQEGMGSGGTVGAVFDGVPVMQAPCRITTVYGACAVYTCASDADAGPGPGAGTLTFTAPSLEGGVTLDAGAGGLYALATPGPVFSPGDSLTVAASGGAVPAFGPESVQAPGAITLTDPATDGGAIDVPTANDLGFAWTGGSEDSVAVLTATGTTSDGALVVARCSYVAITGEGILPSAVLAPLHGLSQGTLGWGQTNVATFDAGAWSVTLLAEAYGSTPATFQ